MPQMPNAAGAVFRKEMIETLRDRRTLIVAVLLPILLTPLVTLGVPYLTSRQRQQREAAESRIAVIGSAAAPDLVAAIVGAGHIAPVVVDDPKQSLVRRHIDAVLEIPSGFAARTASGDASVTISFDESEPRSVIAYQRVAQGVATYSASLAIQHLLARGLTRKDVTPIQITAHSVADRGRMGGAMLAGLLPFLIVIWAALGGQHTALDVGAGERERATLDALLVTPPPRWMLAAGKCAAVFAASLGAVVMVIVSTLVSVRLGSAWGVAELVRSSVPLSLGATTWLIVVSSFLVAFLSAAQVAVSLLARTIREAQQLFTPVYLGATLPAMAAPFLEGWERSGWTYVTPALGPVFALRGLLLGSLGPLHLGLTIGSAAVVTCLALAVVVRALPGAQSAGT